MTVTDTSGERAEPVQAAAWQAHVLDAGAVQAELDRLWAGFHEPGGVAGQEGDEPGPGEGLVRATTLNLIAVARSKAEAARMEAAVARQTRFHPSRAIVFHAAESAAENSPGMDVRVEVLEQPRTRDRPPVRFELIAVETGAGQVEHLVSVVSPLLVAELSDVLWWAGELGDDPRFDDLLAIVDRVLVDSASFADPGAGLATLAALLRRSGRCPAICDFAWTRSAPWRQVVAQFFDAEATRPCLNCLDEVAIGYAGSRPGRGSGLTSALLLTGWLATRLGWRSVSPLAPDGDGWATTVGATDPGSGKVLDVAVRLTPSSDPTHGDGLRAVRLVSRGAAPGTFAVEQKDAVGLTTTSETPTMPRVGRMIHARAPDEAALLDRELHGIERDRVFEEALSFAAGLLDGAEGGRRS